MKQKFILRRTPTQTQVGILPSSKLAITDFYFLTLFPCQIRRKARVMVIPPQLCRLKAGEVLSRVDKR
jgi:hypothetical protein